MPEPTGTEKAVCEDIARRQALGLAKYGTTVADSPLELREWLQHAYEETLDKAIYLKRAIAEMERTLPAEPAVPSSGEIRLPIPSWPSARYASARAGAKPIYPGEPGYEEAPYEVMLLWKRK